MLFTGSYRRALDDKQRLPLPKPIRDSLEPGTRLYLTPGLDGCLAGYPERVFAELADRLATGSPAAKEVREYCRLFYSKASCVVPDRQWRIRVPPELAQWATLAGDVMIVGVRDHMEFWARDKWEHFESQCDPHYDRLAELAFGSSGEPVREPDAKGSPNAFEAAIPSVPR